MPELITAIAQLLWPLIALLAIVVFRRAIGRVLRTAEKRELEFEIGGQKLTMHELNDQQTEMIQDLQRQLSMLSKELADRDRIGIPAETPKPLPVPALPEPPEISGNGDGHTEDEVPPVGSEPLAVLWVSEKPEAHAILAEQLRDNGVRVTMTTNNDAALSELSQRQYRLIVEDMGRKENGRWRPDAGLALLRELRDLGVDTPVIVYSTQRAQQQYGDQARRLGAVGTTSSAYEMFQNLQSFDLL
ncbi:response regulator [Saccharopolyspora sp. NPDC050642]|uniref:response regulator n=1 Tax=Saccharopolyspora sp. NPDC050642 TaxID=3157099 RepID=UPI0033FFF678